MSSCSSRKLFSFFLFKRKLTRILVFSSGCQRKLVENILFLRTRDSNSAGICWPLSRLGEKQSLHFSCCKGVSRMQDSLFNEKTTMSASYSIASEKGEPSRMCHIFIFVLLVANFFLHFLLLVSFFFSISCVANNWACYDVIEGWDSHRNQNWLYQKNIVLLLLFLILEDSWCAIVMRLHMTLTLKNWQYLI